ncbi:MAG: type II secretion system protein [Patescibacteria group bacterium]
MFQVSSLKFQEKNGFTVIELLVVIGVVILLLGCLILYGSVSRNQVALYIEEAKIAQIILRSKALSISTFGNPNVPCGYGVQINPAAKTYSLFSYDVPDCGAISNIDINDPNKYKTVQSSNLPKGVAFQSCPAGGTERLDYVLFMPPDPKTLVWVDGYPTPSAAGSGKIYLATADCSANIVVTVSTAGQVSF